MLPAAGVQSGGADNAQPAGGSTGSGPLASSGQVPGLTMLGVKPRLLVSRIAACWVDRGLAAMSLGFAACAISND